MPHDGNQLKTGRLLRQKVRDQGQNRKTHTRLQGVM